MWPGKADKMKRPRQNRGLFQIGPILYGQETNFVFIGQFYNVFQIQHERFAGLKGYNMEPCLVGAFQRAFAYHGQIKPCVLVRPGHFYNGYGYVFFGRFVV